MKFLRFCALCLACLCAFSLGISAAAELSFDFSEKDSTVDPFEYFLDAINSSEYPNVELKYENSVWFFDNFSISRDAFAWRNFSLMIGVLGSEACRTAKVRDALSGTAAVYLDFTDHQAYPGLAEISITLGEEHKNASFSVFSLQEVIEEETDDYFNPLITTEPVSPKPDFYLVHLADDLKSDELGRISICTEASRDYILIPTGNKDSAKALLELCTHPDYSNGDTSESAFLSFIKSDTFLIIGSAVIALALALAVYMIIYKKRAHRKTR